jgi:hypothetical protein
MMCNSGTTWKFFLDLVDLSSSRRRRKPSAATVGVAWDMTMRAASSHLCKFDAEAGQQQAAERGPLLMPQG